MIDERTCPHGFYAFRTVAQLFSASTPCTPRRRSRALTRSHAQHVNFRSTRTPVKHLDSETHNGTQKCNRKHPSNHIHEGFPLSLSHFTNSHENYRWSRGYLSGSMQCVTVRPRGHAPIHT